VSNAIDPLYRSAESKFQVLPRGPASRVEHIDLQVRVERLRHGVVTGRRDAPHRSDASVVTRHADVGPGSKFISSVSVRNAPKVARPNRAPQGAHRQPRRVRSSRAKPTMRMELTASPTQEELTLRRTVVGGVGQPHFAGTRGSEVALDVAISVCQSGALGLARTLGERTRDFLFRVETPRATLAYAVAGCLEFVGDESITEDRVVVMDFDRGVGQTCILLVTRPDQSREPLRETHRGALEPNNSLCGGTRHWLAHERACTSFWAEVLGEVDCGSTEHLALLLEDSSALFEHAQFGSLGLFSSDCSPSSIAVRLSQLCRVVSEMPKPLVIWGSAPRCCERYERRRLGTRREGLSQGCRPSARENSRVR